MPKTETVIDLNDLISDPANARKHSEKNLEAISSSLSRFGPARSIVIDKNGVVRAGNGTLEAARAAGVKKVRVVQADDGELVAVLRSDWTDAEAAGYAIADNRTAELGEWDDEVLRRTIAELKDTDTEMLDSLGFDGDMLDDLLVDPVDVGAHTREPPEPAEPPAEPMTRPGDLWTLGVHRLLCGDSTSVEDVSRLMDGRLAVLMNTDPPYGIDYVRISDQVHDKQSGRASIENDDLLGSDLQEFLEASIRAAVPHLAKTAAFYLWHPMLTQGTFFAAAADILIHRQIIWVKPSLIMGRGDYHWRHELCFYGWQRGNRPPFYGPRNQDTIWEVGRESGSGHPTQKPIELFERPILNHTKVRQVVYEPFAGSGSQLIAAEKLGRICYGLEISPAYCDVILRRWMEYTGRVPTRESDGARFEILSP